MADKKVSQLATLSSTTAEDLLYVVDDPNGTPTSKKMTVKTFFSSVPSNTVFNARVTARANVSITCSNTFITSNANFLGAGLTRVNNMIHVIKLNPASNNALTHGYKIGAMFVSNTFLYVAVNATTLKRVALATF